MFTVYVIYYYTYSDSHDIEQGTSLYITRYCVYDTCILYYFFVYVNIYHSVWTVYIDMQIKNIQAYRERSCQNHGEEFQRRKKPSMESCVW